MKSIFVKVLLWFLATLIVCLAGSTITSAVRNRLAPGRHDFFSRSLALQVSDARTAYESGGRPALQAYFKRLDSFFPGSHRLVDSNGIDLVTGKDRSAELREVGPHFSPVTDSRMALAWPTRDGKYRLVIDAPSPPGPWSPIPNYLWMIGATIVFCYILAVQLASPLRSLQQTVERFGSGDFAVRASRKRRDEFGKLAAAFNNMADRIESLLLAERRLLQDVSHELRSPLARLRFAVELARTNPDPERSMNRIQKEVDRLTALVSELLEATRPESDLMSSKPEDVGLAHLLRDVVEDNSLESQAHACQIELMTPADDVSVRGDRELLRRAIENVLRNAIRFAPAGSAVEIELRRDRETAVIEIRDRGPGVPEEALSNIFKPFFRVEADRNRSTGGGVGLGLSIAHRAVLMHKGAIHAENAHPGLTVQIALPALQARELASVP
jgi:two-component system sensor histidine kinase CpxA